MVDKKKYFLIYLSGFLFTLSIKLLKIARSDYLIIDASLTSIIFSTYLFLFSYYFETTNIVDMAWGALGVLLIIIDLINGKINTNIYSLAAIFLVLIYSLKHIILYFVNFHPLSKENEDFRYKSFAKNLPNKTIFLIFNYISLHIIPLLNLVLINYPAIEIIQSHEKFHSGYSDFLTLVTLLQAISSLGFEIYADEELRKFRKKRELFSKRRSSGNIIQSGTWLLVKHPNYLGEVCFAGSLLLFNFTILKKTWLEVTLTSIGFIMYLCLFLFYSIPVMQKKLKEKYGKEYEEYSQIVKYNIFPLIY
jgi:steroid 5-alpha reductase family enzyme